MTYTLYHEPTIRHVRFLKSHRTLHEADERYAKYLTEYYYNEINGIIDDEAVIAGAGVKKWEKKASRLLVKFAN